MTGKIKTTRKFKKINKTKTEIAKMKKPVQQIKILILYEEE